MEKNHFKIWIIITGIIFTGCSTPYQKMGHRGGYSDYPLNENTFVVSFKGNSHTSSDKVQRYVLRRCSEVTLKNGYSHFILTGLEDNSTSSLQHYSNTNIYGNTSSTTNTSGQVYGDNIYMQSQSQGNIYGSSNTTEDTYVVTKSGYTVIMKCFKGNPNMQGGSTVIDASLFLKSNDDDDDDEEDDEEDGEEDE